jgi:hypothetical protein
MLRAEVRQEGLASATGGSVDISFCRATGNSAGFRSSTALKIAGEGKAVRRWHQPTSGNGPPGAGPPTRPTAARFLTHPAGVFHNRLEDRRGGEGSRRSPRGVVIPRGGAPGGFPSHVPPELWSRFVTVAPCRTMSLRCRFCHQKINDRLLQNYVIEVAHCS